MPNYPNSLLLKRGRIEIRCQTRASEYEDRKKTYKKGDRMYLGKVQSIQNMNEEYLFIVLLSPLPAEYAPTCKVQEQQLP